MNERDYYLSKVIAPDAVQQGSPTTDPQELVKMLTRFHGEMRQRVSVVLRVLPMCEGGYTYPELVVENLEPITWRRELYKRLHQHSRLGGLREGMSVSVQHNDAIREGVISGGNWGAWVVQFPDGDEATYRDAEIDALSAPEKTVKA